MNHQKNQTPLEDYDRCKQSLEHLFTPYIRVIPDNNWSKIKAIWIPLLHHDYQQKSEKSHAIIITKQKTDQFGTVQGYLTAPNENYIPYQTTFFNPALTDDQIIDLIQQADNNIVQTVQVFGHTTPSTIVRTIKIGFTNTGMQICINYDHNDKIVDAFPIFGSNLHQNSWASQPQVIPQAAQKSEKTSPAYRSIIIKYNQATNSYIPTEPISYDFYLLYLLLQDATSSDIFADLQHWINNSSMQCLATCRLFLHKNKRHVELFAIYDLIDTENLCLPKSPQLIISMQQCIDFIKQASSMHSRSTQQFFIAIDDQHNVHLTDNLQSIIKKSFWQSMSKRMIGLFS